MRTRRSDLTKGSPDYLASKVVQLDADYAHLSKSFDDFAKNNNRNLENLEKSINALSEKINQKNEVSWPLIVSIVVAGVIVFGLINQVMTAPINAHISYIEGNIGRYDLRSQRHEDELSRLTSSSERTVNKLAEIETQFIANSHIRNLQLQKQYQLISILWQMANPNVKLPDDDYYPVVGKTEAEWGP